MIYFTGKCLRIMQNFTGNRECRVLMLRRLLNPPMFLFKLDSIGRPQDQIQCMLKRGDPFKLYGPLSAACM